VKERRSGLIPCGGPVEPFAAPNVLLIGDAAGHVSPLTGGGIRMAFRYGRRSAQLIADYLTRHGPPPERVLARELPSFTKKLLLRTVMDAGPPNWFYNLIIGTAPMRWFARQVYFHKRAEGERESPQS
jgi:flavin-dependent dehydrogenase